MGKITEDVWHYLQHFLQSTPSDLLHVFGWILFLTTILSILVCRTKVFRYVIGLLLLEYVSILYYLTIYYRKVNLIHNYNFEPFWSYKAYASGMESLLAEIILNILVFIPVGLLLGIALNTATWKKAFITGVCISIMIEISQFIFKRGFSELDDVIHNVVGCLVGYGLYSLVKWTWLKVVGG